MIPDSLKEQGRRACQWLAICLAVCLGAVVSWIYQHREELTETDAEKAAKGRK